jgi:hypothetical protein
MLVQGTVDAINERMREKRAAKEDLMLLAFSRLVE